MIGALVEFTMRTLTFVPAGLAANGPWHGSPLVFPLLPDPELPLVEGAPVGDAMIDSVGKASKVGLGSGVGLGKGVGGIGVAVGTAACVRATIVLAAATADA